MEENITEIEKFREFGKNIYKFASFTLINYFIPIIGIIIALFYLFKAIENSRNFKSNRHSDLLRLWKEQLINAYKMQFLTLSLLVIGIVLFVISYQTFFENFNPYNPNTNVFPIFDDLLLFSIFSCISNIMGRIMESKAWENLKEFFLSEDLIIPEANRWKAADATEKLRLSAILNSLSFLFFPLFVSFIYFFIGLFTLGTAFDNMDDEYLHSDIQTIQPSPTHSPQEEKVEILEDSKTCGSCGSKLQEHQKYCQICGKKINFD